MIKRIATAVCALLVVVGFWGNKATFAWFTTAGESYQSFVVGDVSYELEGSFRRPNEGELIVPNQELIAEREGEDYNTCLTNKSTIPTQLRIKIEYTLTTDGGEDPENPGQTLAPATLTYTNAVGGLDVTFYTGEGGAQLWYNNGNYFYYGAYDLGNHSSTVVEVGESITIPLISSIKYSGPNTVSSVISGQNVTVRVVFEARQSEAVNWDHIGSIAITL